MKWLSFVSVPELVQVTAEDGESRDLAIMLTGVGARAAYQVGLLRGLARHFPHLRFQIITGVSAGAINAVFLASTNDGLTDAVDRLSKLWCDLRCHHVFRPNYTALFPFRGAIKSIFPGRIPGGPHGLFNPAPLASLLRRLFSCPIRRMPIDGIRRNLELGKIKSVALVALDYSTGQSVRWVQGRNIDVFEGPNRRVARADFKPKLSAKAAHAVGNYALQIDFNDGHTTGIYSFDYLRTICPCEDCAREFRTPSDLSSL